VIAGFSLTQLGYFTTVAEHGSIAAAAEVAHVTQAAVSTGIQDLERRLGVELLARRPGRRVSLTEAGSAILVEAKRVLAAADTLVLGVRTPDAELRGVLRIGFFSTLSPLYLPPLLTALAEEHPALELAVTEGSQDDMKHAIHTGACELVITYSEGIGGGVTTSQIRRLLPYALLPAGHPLAGRQFLTDEDLADEPLIRYTHDAAIADSERGLRSLKFSPRTVHRSTNIEVVRSLVGRGMGWAAMYQRWPNDLTSEGLPLACVPLADEFPSIDVVAAWPVQDHLSAQARAAITILKRGTGHSGAPPWKPALTR
jgi:DNA-binding transcriptional LysR family regulator